MKLHIESYGNSKVIDFWHKYRKQIHRYSGLGSNRDWGKIAHQALIFLWGIYLDK